MKVRLEKKTKLSTHFYLTQKINQIYKQDDIKIIPCTLRSFHVQKFYFFDIIDIFELVVEHLSPVFHKRLRNWRF